MLGGGEELYSSQRKAQRKLAVSRGEAVAARRPVMTAKVRGKNGCPALSATLFFPEAGMIRDFHRSTRVLDESEG